MHQYIALMRIIMHVLLVLDSEGQVGDISKVGARCSGNQQFVRYSMSGKKGSGGKKGGSPPNAPSKTGNPSGGGRGNNPPKR